MAASVFAVESVPAERRTPASSASLAGLFSDSGSALCRRPWNIVRVSSAKALEDWIWLILSTAPF